MKILDVLGSGVKAAASAAKAIVAPADAPRRRDRDAEEELQRRKAVNAAADERRAAREAALSGLSRWIPRRRHWLEGRR